MHGKARHKGFLHRVQSFLRQALYGGELSTFGANRQGHARLYRLTVEENRTGPAMSGVAAYMGPPEPRFLSDVADQQKPGRHYVFKVFAVNSQFDPVHDSTQSLVRPVPSIDLLP